jgi:hypothetical protein
VSRAESAEDAEGRRAQRSSREILSDLRERD